MRRRDFISGPQYQVRFSVLRSHSGLTLRETAFSLPLFLFAVSSSHSKRVSRSGTPLEKHEDQTCTNQRAG